MSNLNFKIKEMKSLINYLDDSDVKTSMFHVLEDMRLLQNSEIQSELSWESLMLAILGTDGIGGAKRILIRLLNTLESIETMPPDVARRNAALKARNVLELINDEKSISRSDQPVFKKF